MLWNRVITHGKITIVRSWSVFAHATEHKRHNWFVESPTHTAKHPSQRTSSQTRSQAETTWQETHQPHAQVGGTLVGPSRDTHWPTTTFTGHHQDDKTEVLQRYAFVTKMVAEPVCRNRRSTKQRQSVATRRRSRVHRRFLERPKPNLLSQILLRHRKTMWADSRDTFTDRKTVPSMSKVSQTRNRIRGCEFSERTEIVGSC